MSAKKQKTILLVEDEAIIAMTEKKILEKFGYHVIVAGSGEEAIAVFEKTPGIDLILIDINLGAGIDGTEAAAIILKQRDLPVVFLSSHTEPEVVAKTEKITYYGYVVKNSSSTVLDASIKMAFKLFEAKTKEKEKEEALGESEEWNKLILSTVLSGVMVIEADTRTIVDVNDTALKIIGLPKERVIGSICHHFICPAEESNCPVLDLGRNVDLSEKILLTGDGKQKNIIKTVVPVIRQGRKYLIESFVDVTERKQAEETISQSKQDWEDCFDSIADMITMHDNDYNIMRTNKAGKALLKLPTITEHLRLKCFSFYHGTDAPPAGCPSCACLKNGKPGVFELFEPHLNRYLEIRAIPRFDGNNQRAGIIHIVRDISERKQQEEEKEQIISLQRATIESTADGLLVIGHSGKITDFNSRFAQMWRIPDSILAARDDAQALGFVLDQLVDPQGFLAKVNELYAAPGKESFDLLQLKDGRYFERYSRPQLISGLPVGRVWSFRDVSERKRAEDALKESEKKFRNIFENVLDAYYEAAIDGTILEISPAIAALSKGQYHRDELVGKSMNDFYSDPGKRRHLLETLQERGYVTDYEITLKNRDGSEIPCSISAKIQFDAHGRPEKIVGTLRDISERKLAEEKLQKNEKRMQDIMSNMADWVWEVDENGKYTYSSEKGSKFLGSSRGDIIGKTPFDFMPPEEAKRVAAVFSEIVAGKLPIRDLENWNIGSNGERICLLTNGTPVLDEDGNLRGYRGVDKDITERKRAEKLSEALYKISQAIYAADNLNELFAQVHHALASIIPTDNLFIALLSDDGRALTFPYFIDEKNPGDNAPIATSDHQSLTVEVLATKKSLLLDEAELLDRYANGRNKVWGTAPKCWLGVPLMIRDTIIGVMAVQDYHKAGAYGRKDVALLESTAGQIAVAIDRKRAAEALRESVDSFKGYFNMGTVGMCVSSLETGWIEVNDCLCRMLGYTREELLHLTWAEMTHPDDLNVDLDLFNQVLAGERDSYELEKRFIRKDGQVIYTQLYATCQRNPDGTVHHLLASLVDVSERKRAEAVMRENNSRLELAMQAADMAWWEMDMASGNVTFEKRKAEMLGFPPEKFKHFQDFMALVHPEDHERAMNAMRMHLKGEVEKYETEYRIATRSGEYKWFYDIGSVVKRDAAGKPLNVTGLVINITERKQAEILEQAVYEIARAADKAASLDDLYRSVHRIIQTLMPATNILIARYDEKEDMVSFPYFVDEKDPMPKSRKSSRGLTDYVLRTGRTLLSDPALEKELERSGEAKRRGSPSACWLGVPLKAGDKAIGVIALDNYTDPKAYGEREKKILEYVSGQIANAIERKQAEEEIKRQLLEKEILLKEVHHRIKNNIASIGGLISLRLQSISNPEAVAVLQDAIGRVDSMRILYDKLLLSEDYADISVKNYVESLIDTVITLFPDNVKIKIDKCIADFHLGSKKLFPLGIIINELLTNKMKYAFSGRKQGSIRISLALAAKRATLTIEDDGNTLPPGFDVKGAKGFGLMLVNMLSQQLGGSFVIENHAGVRCTVEFDI